MKPRAGTSNYNLNYNFFSTEAEGKTANRRMQLLPDPKALMAAMGRMSQFLSLLVSLSLAWPASAFTSQMPNRLTLRRHALAASTFIDVTRGENLVTMIYRHSLGALPQYNVSGVNGLCEVQAFARRVSFGVMFDVQSSDGALIGIIEEHICDAQARYLLIDSKGQPFAQGKTYSLGTRHEVTALQGRQALMTLERLALAAEETWTVRVLDWRPFAEHGFVPFALFLCAAIQTDLDYWARPHGESAPHLRFSPID